ncbi:hypothetical protein F4604DRAFT_1680588 [Suillus subluteus]|nr:hypothetical protein F4604DRAFT_1680588 [Suillus subluteus]
MQHKQIRQWLANEKSDPVRALEIKEQNTTNKRAWRKCKREEMEKTRQTAGTSTQGNSPQKQCQALPTEASSDIAGPSNSAHDPIPTAETPSGLDGPSNSTHGPIAINPVLLNQEAPYDWHSKSRQLCDEISAALHISKAIIIWQVTAPEPATLDLDYLEECGFHLSPPTGHPCAIYEQYMLHGPANWTNPHHDSDGGTTFIQIETGQKKWGLFRLINKDMVTCTNLSEMALALEIWHGEIITLLPGDILSASIQPAGQFHTVHMPVASFARGGHVYNYEFMHLTELSRYIDHKLGKTFTNQVHEHSLATFH